MNEKIPCAECGTFVLPSTAERTGGLCMPCKNGNRKNIEQAKAYYTKERELEKICPFRALWRRLVDKVYKQDGGFAALSEDEKLYYSVNSLSGEVYNGGFTQYFDNSSSDHYLFAEQGLMRIHATNSLELLRQAKEILFAHEPVPTDQAKRWEVIRKLEDEPKLDDLDTEFYKDLDHLDSKLELFSVKVGLVENA